MADDQRGAGWVLFAAIVMIVTGWINSLTCQFALQPLIPNDGTRTLVEQGVAQGVQLLFPPLWSVAWVLMYYDVRILARTARAFRTKRGGIVPGPIQIPRAVLVMDRQRFIGLRGRANCAIRYGRRPHIHT